MSLASELTKANNVNKPNAAEIARTDELETPVHYTKPVFLPDHIVPLGTQGYAFIQFSALGPWILCKDGQLVKATSAYNSYGWNVCRAECDRATIESIAVAMNAAAVQSVAQCGQNNAATWHTAQPSHVLDDELSRALNLAEMYQSSTFGEDKERSLLAKALLHVWALYDVQPSQSAVEELKQMVRDATDAMFSQCGNSYINTWLESWLRQAKTHGCYSGPLVGKIADVQPNLSGYLTAGAQQQAVQPVQSECRCPYCGCSAK